MNSESCHTVDPARVRRFRYARHLGQLPIDPPLQSARIKGLAIVRCGDSSLHPSWATSSRAFDVGISYFGDNAEEHFPEADYVHRSKGGKWDGIYKFFKQFPKQRNDMTIFGCPMTIFRPRLKISTGCSKLGPVVAIMCSNRP